MNVDEKKDNPYDQGRLTDCERVRSTNKGAQKRLRRRRREARRRRGRWSSPLRLGTQVRDTSEDWVGTGTTI